MQLAERVNYSQFQKNILEWVQYGKGNAVVEAVAGSGKTFTLKECCRIIFEEFNTKPLAIAFNRHIKEEMTNKIGEYAQVQTFNSLGHGLVRDALRKHLTVEDTKYYKISRAIVYDNCGTDDKEYTNDVIQELKTVADFCMKTLTRTKSLVEVEEMVERYSLDVEYLDVIFPWLGQVIKEGDKVARQGIISYSDQLFLPFLWNLQPTVQYDWILGDEMQDTSSASLELFLKFSKPSGRILCVGDRNQSIFGFAGANSDALERLVKATEAIVLPLSICYRCPASHIELAQELVPHIQASPTAIEGEVIKLELKDSNKSGGYTYSELFPLIQKGDLIICRLTAPLISLCIKLIAQRKAAKVKGREVGASLVKIISAVAKMPGFSFDDFPVFLEQYQNVRVAKFLVKDEQQKIQALEDKVAGILACYEAFSDCRNVESFKKEVNALFSEGNSTITLSTIHRAKGLEAERVILLHPEYCGKKRDGMNAEAYRQELNIEYVAKTRSKYMLILAYGVPKKKRTARNSIWEEIKKNMDSPNEGQWGGIPDDDFSFDGSTDAFGNKLDENYFNNCNTVEQVKERYRTLAMQLHPDMPTGSEESMKDLNRQYDNLMAKH